MEQKQNESENKKLLGEIVKYSNVIQVSVNLLSLKRGEYFMDNLHLLEYQIALKFWGAVVCSLVVLKDDMTFS